MHDYIYVVRRLINPNCCRFTRDGRARLWLGGLVATSIYCSCDQSKAQIHATISNKATTESRSANVLSICYIYMCVFFYFVSKLCVLPTQPSSKAGGHKGKRATLRPPPRLVVVSLNLSSSCFRQRSTFLGAPATRAQDKEVTGSCIHAGVSF